jgi:hypothetical protein
MFSVRKSNLKEPVQSIFCGKIRKLQIEKILGSLSLLKQQ